MTLPTTYNSLDHFLRSLIYRFKHVTTDAPETFADFEASEGVRTPIAVVRHMTGLIAFTQHQLDDTARKPLEPLEWHEELLRFERVIQKLARTLKTSLEVKGELELGQLWRGPMIDAMTHIGQLAMLRRLAGSPVEGVRYWQVEMPGFNDKNFK